MGYEYEAGKLVKVNGQRIEYMDGNRLIALARKLGEQRGALLEALERLTAEAYRNMTGGHGDLIDEAYEAIKLAKEMP